MANVDDNENNQKTIDQMKHDNNNTIDVLSTLYIIILDANEKLKKDIYALQFSSR